MFSTPTALRDICPCQQQILRVLFFSVIVRFSQSSGDKTRLSIKTPMNTSFVRLFYSNLLIPLTTVYTFFTYWHTRSVYSFHFVVNGARAFVKETLAHVLCNVSRVVWQTLGRFGMLSSSPASVLLRSAEMLRCESDESSFLAEPCVLTALCFRIGVYCCGGWVFICVGCVITL